MMAKPHMREPAACAETEVIAAADANRDALKAFTSEFGIVWSSVDKVMRMIEAAFQSALTARGHALIAGCGFRIALDKHETI